MSLRDDLETLIAWLDLHSVQFHGNGKEIERAIDRLRVALTPAAEKWLEALPGILDAYENKSAHDLHGMLWTAAYDADMALHEVAALHNAQDNKEQK